MSPLFTYEGKLLKKDGKLATNIQCCCAACAPCQCNNFCVCYKMNSIGNVNPGDPPFPPTVLTDYAIIYGDDCGPPKAPCFNFNQPIPNDPTTTFDKGCVDNLNQQWIQICSSADGSVLGLSKGGDPCARIRCNKQGQYFLDFCIFNMCSGFDAAVGARLTIKTYALTLGNDGCPVSVGQEVGSVSSDWMSNSIDGPWQTLAQYNQNSNNPIDFDGQAGNGQNWCNKDCWNEFPFDLQLKIIGNGPCECNE